MQKAQKLLVVIVILWTIFRVIVFSKHFQEDFKSFVSLFGTTREEKWEAVLGKELYDFVNIVQKTIPPFSHAKFVFDLNHYRYARAIYHMAPIIISDENYQYMIAFHNGDKRIVQLPSLNDL